MEISDLVAQLNKLQIEQNKILEQIADRSKPADKKPKAAKVDKDLAVGDNIVLLTNGAKCRKGGKARVTKITLSTVHFVVLRNNHHTYKKHRNVQKI